MSQRSLGAPFHPARSLTGVVEHVHGRHIRLHLLAALHVGQAVVGDEEPGPYEALGARARALGQATVALGRRQLDALHNHGLLRVEMGREGAGRGRLTFSPVRQPFPCKPPGGHAAQAMQAGLPASSSAAHPQAVLDDGQVCVGGALEAAARGVEVRAGRVECELGACRGRAGRQVAVSAMCGHVKPGQAASLPDACIASHNGPRACLPLTLAAAADGGQRGIERDPGKALGGVALEGGRVALPKGEESGSTGEGRCATPAQRASRWCLQQALEALAPRPPFSPLDSPPSSH